MILPIHLLTTGDELEFGKEYVLLSHLKRMGFPVASGFVVSPPLTEIKHFLIDHNVLTLLDFETKQTLLSEKILTALPADHQIDENERQYLRTHWPQLVSRWLTEIHSHYTRYGTFNPKYFHLKAIPIFFSVSPIASGVASFNPVTKAVDIEFANGQLDHGYQAYLEDLVRKASRKLGLHYDYHFIYGSDGLKFTRIKGANHRLIKQESKKNLFHTPGKNRSKRGIKLYTTFGGDFIVDEFCDGYYLESEHFSSHDQKLWALLETMMAKHPQEILYQISDRFIKSDAAAVKFCRNQKKQDNIHLVFEGNGGSEKMLELKRELAALGVNRKGKMKFWVRLALPALLLRITEIIDTGFDGVVIDLDLLAASLHMRDITQLGMTEDIEGTITFLEPIIKQLQKVQIPVMVYGKLAASEKMVDQAIRWKVFGLVIFHETEKMDELVSFKEQVLHFGLGRLD